jgi:hypothetical protein
MMTIKTVIIMVVVLVILMRSFLMVDIAMLTVIKTMSMWAIIGMAVKMVGIFILLLY